MGHLHLIKSCFDGKVGNLTGQEYKGRKVVRSSIGHREISSDAQYKAFANFAEYQRVLSYTMGHANYLWRSPDYRLTRYQYVSKVNKGFLQLGTGGLWLWDIPGTEKVAALYGKMKRAATPYDLIITLSTIGFDGTEYGLAVQGRTVNMDGSVTDSQDMTMVPNQTASFYVHVGPTVKPMWAMVIPKEEPGKKIIGPAAYVAQGIWD